MNNISTILIILGIIILIIGLIIKLDVFPIGRLPGDILVKKENFTFYFPIVTSILISIVISVIVWFLRK